MSVSGSPITSSGTFSITTAVSPTGSGAIVLENSPTLLEPTANNLTALGSEPFVLKNGFGIIITDFSSLPPVVYTNEDIVISAGHIPLLGLTSNYFSTSSNIYLQNGTFCTTGPDGAGAAYSFPFNYDINDLTVYNGDINILSQNNAHIYSREKFKVKSEKEMLISCGDGVMDIYSKGFYFHTPTGGLGFEGINSNISGTIAWNALADIELLGVTGAKLYSNGATKLSAGQFIDIFVEDVVSSLITLVPCINGDITLRCNGKFFVPGTLLAPFYTVGSINLVSGSTGGIGLDASGGGVTIECHAFGPVISPPFPLRLNNGFKVICTDGGDILLQTVPSGDIFYPDQGQIIMDSKQVKILTPYFHIYDSFVFRERDLIDGIPNRDFVVSKGLELTGALTCSIAGWSGAALHIPAYDFTNTYVGTSTSWDNVYLGSTRLLGPSEGGLIYTRAATLVVEPPVEGVGVTIDKAYAIYCSGEIFVLEKAEFTGRVELGTNFEDVLVVGNSSTGGNVGIKLQNDKGAMEFGIANSATQWNFSSLTGDAIIRVSSGKSLILGTNKLIIGISDQPELALLKMATSLGQVEFGVVQTNAQVDGKTLIGGTVLKTTGNLTLQSGSNWNLSGEPITTTNSVFSYSGNGTTGTVTVGGGINVYPIGRRIYLEGFSTARAPSLASGNGLIAYVRVVGGITNYPIGQQVVLLGFTQTALNGTWTVNGGDSTQITFSSSFNGSSTYPGFAASVRTSIPLNGSYVVTGGNITDVYIASTITFAFVLGNCYILNHPECKVYGNVVHEGSITLVGSLEDGDVGIVTPSITVEDLTPSKLVVSNIVGTLDSIEGGTEGQLLTIVGGNPDWKTLDLTSGMTGVLPIVNGGTGLSVYGTDGQLFTSVNIVTQVNSFSGNGVTLTINVGSGNGLAKHPIGSSIELRSFQPSAINGTYIVSGGSVSSIYVQSSWLSATVLGRVEMITTVWETPSISMSSEVVGILPVANGGTNLATYGAVGQLLTCGTLSSNALSFVSAGGNVILGVTGGVAGFPVGRQVVLSGFITTPVSINGPQTITGGGLSTINFASSATSCSVVGVITMVETLWANPATSGIY